MTVELIPTLGALSPRGGPIQDPVLTPLAPPLQSLLEVEAPHIKVHSYDWCVDLDKDRTGVPRS